MPPTREKIYPSLYPPPATPAPEAFDPKPKHQPKAHKKESK